MRPLVVYFTRTNNTAVVARALAKELDADLIAYSQVSIAEIERQMQGRSLIALGSGVYNLRPAKQTLALIGKVPKGAKLLFFFTSGFEAPFLLRWYKRPILGRVRKHGVDLVALWRCPGHDKHPAFKWANINVDRPNQRDLDDLRVSIAALRAPAVKE